MMFCTPLAVFAPKGFVLLVLCLNARAILSVLVLGASRTSFWVLLP